MGFRSGGGGFNPSRANIDSSTTVGGSETDFHQVTGSMSVSGQLEVRRAGTQQKWAYDADHEATLTVGSNGETVLAVVGDTVSPSPASDLVFDVSSGGDVFIRRSGDRLRFGVSTGDTFIQTDNQNTDISFRVHPDGGLGAIGTEVFRVDASGAGALLVSGTTSSPGGNAPINFRDTATSIHSPASNRLAITAPLLEVTGALRVSSSVDGQTVFQVDTFSQGAQGFSIIDSGNKAYATIGKTAQATYALDVGGTTRSNLLVSTVDGTSYGFKVGQDLHHIYSDAGKLTVDVKNDNNVVITTGSANRVGIGVTSPTAKLHVSSSDGTAPLFRIDHQSPGDNLSSKPIFYVTGSGLIGIGTDSPRQAADPYSTGEESTRVHILGEHGTDQGEDPVQNTLLMLENNNHAGIQFMVPNQKSGQIAWGKPGTNRMANMYFSSADNRYHFEGPGFGSARIMTMVASGDSINMGSSQGVGMTQTSASLFISSSTEGDTLGSHLNHAVLFQLAHENSPQLLFVTGSGRMGLGTWAPSASLHVSSSDTTGVPVFQVDGISGNEPHIYTQDINLGEHVTNGSFSDASNWTLGGTGFAIGSNKATFTYSAGAPQEAQLTQAVADLAQPIVPGRLYALSYTISDNTGFSGNIILTRNDGSSGGYATGIAEQAYNESQLYLQTSNGNHTLLFRADFNPGSFQIKIEAAAGVIALANLSIVEAQPNVGIGTDKPAALLHVSASSQTAQNLFTVSPGLSDTGDNRPAFSIVQDDSGNSFTTFGQGPQQAYAMSINLNNGANSAMQIANGTVSALVDSFTFGNSGFTSKVIIAKPNVPVNASAAGTAGEIAWDSGHFYVCVATNTWKRVAISTF